MRKSFASLVVLVVLLIPNGPAHSQAPPPVPPPFCESTGILKADELPTLIPHDPACPLIGRIVEDHGVKIPIPIRGVGMGAEALLEGVDGDVITQILGLSTTLEGTVELLNVGDEAGGQTDESAAGSSPAPCEDDQSNLYVHKEYDTLKWHFKRDSWQLIQFDGPDLTRDQVESALRDAVSDITHMENSCGAADTVPQPLPTRETPAKRRR